MLKPINSSLWSPTAAAETYGFARWGDGLFRINEHGDVCVHPAGDERSIRLLDVIEEARAAGLSAPLTIRFQDILRQRVERMNKAFAQAIADEEYEGRYRGVFPIKVNQLREVVEEILDAGEPFAFGLECGSKPELLIALAFHDDVRRLLICNGYKDDEYIRLALLGRKLGKEVILVVEQPGEMDAILRVAREMDVKPLIGIRLKLTTEGEGKWAKSSGDDAKFGLTPPEIMGVVRKLRRAKLQDSLRLVHFHIGSQVPNILTLKKAVIEAARYYTELAKLGFPMGLLDVGGGLGIDYDGSRTNYESSMNYSLEEYARDVVFNVKQICERADVPVPNIVSESGRALVAQHSMLVVEVMDRIHKPDYKPAQRRAKAKRHALLEDLEHIRENEQGLSVLERFHDAQAKKEEALNLFTLGYLDLETRAEAEGLFWQICRQLHAESRLGSYIPEDLEALDALLADQYVCNFSVFQSLIDHWACDQLFPIAPLHRHLEEPTVRASLADITCDSDGKVDRFIDLQEESTGTLPVHPLNGSPYYLGIFCVGAYQDIMGDLHNLFGRANEVHVFLEEDESDGFYIEEVIEGFKVNDVLPLIQYETKDLVRRLKRQIDRATRADTMKPREGVGFLKFYEGLVRGGTYLNVTPGKRRVRRTATKKPK